ncbi:MAG: FHA domain-containing protein [Planctomycetales bacterium]|nr:FHA domain-containing protein [Planctomycetales bacterium]MCA9171383.1 FHA domain-containing protein [Planctomycetales bacterium]
MLKIELTVVGGELESRDVSLQLPATIGRGGDVDLKLAHPLVSRRHCELLESDGSVVVRDLGSLNGTFIGSERIEEAPLAPGELLTVGTVTFRASYQPLGSVGEIANQETQRIPTARDTVRSPAAKRLPTPARPAIDPLVSDAVVGCNAPEATLDARSNAAENVDAAESDDDGDLHNILPFDAASSRASAGSRRTTNSRIDARQTEAGRTHLNCSDAPPRELKDITDDGDRNLSIPWPRRPK